MNNHWMDAARRRKLIGEIEDIFADVWAADGRFVDLIEALTEEQLTILMDMHIKDGSIEEEEVRFVLVKP